MAEGNESQDAAPGGGSQASNEQLQDTGNAGGGAAGGGGDVGGGAAAAGGGGAGDTSSEAEQPEKPTAPSEPADVRTLTEETTAAETPTEKTPAEGALTAGTSADKTQTDATRVEPQGGGQPPTQQQPPAGMPDDDWMYKPPSDSLVTGGGILLIMFFLLSLTVGLLYQITVHWPACELTQETAEKKGQGDGNTNANSDNTNVNTNVNANVNTNVNVNSNANGNSNVNANRNLNGNAGRAANSNVNRPPVTMNSPAPGEAPKETAANGNAAKADMDSAEPKTGSIKGNTLVVIKGKDFQKDDVVKFDNEEAKRGSSSAESISVRTPPHEEGTVDITIHRGNEVMDTLRAEYTYVCPAPTGSELFLMLIMAGALGGCIHALRSLYWYTGQGELKWKWLPMYFVLPFTGAATATIFSLLIVAGFVSNTTGRGESLFIIAVAGLVGMFSQQAALKLTDIANAFFTKPGEGKDANSQESLSVSAGAAKTPLTVTAMSPVKGTDATEVTITGTGFTDATTVTFNDLAAVVKKVTPTAIIVTPPAQPKDTAADVKVKLGNQSVPAPVKFTYS